MRTQLYRQLWAKSSDEGVGHSLLGHLLDVGLVAEVLLQMPQHATLLADFSEITRCSREEVSVVITLLVAAHDIGKASPAFQQKWPPGVPAQLREERLFGRYPDVFHGEASAVYLYDWLAEKGWKKRFRAMAANAVGVHHGHLLRNGFWLDAVYDYRALARDTKPWHGLRLQLLADLETAFGKWPNLHTPRSAPPAKLWVQLAGLTTIADWIGSGLSLQPPITDVNAYVRARRSDVSEHLHNIGWAQPVKWWLTPAKPESFASWFTSFGAQFTPRPLQLATEQAARVQAGRPSLTIIEAPMGEGKTEAAFYLLTQSVDTSGAYIALPTQATSDALFDRLEKYVAEHAKEPMYVALAHSSARLSKGLQRVETHAEGVAATADQARWFSSGRKDLLARLGVGTVDQALLGVVPVKHHFVRLTALANKVVVLDEVHAYDTYTSGLIEKLVRWLAALGTTVVLMSATLPDAVRQRLANAYAQGLGIPEPELEAQPYPRLTKVTAENTRAISFSATPGRERTVQLVGAPYTVDQLAEFVLTLPCKGAIGVIVNTVQRAQELYQAVRAKRNLVHLIHARLPLHVRKEREAQLLTMFGSGSRGERTGIVIATQVIEQSLDIDFDVLLTDLAPVDLILQRAGRLHRHDRIERGAFLTPKLYVCGLHCATAPGPDRDALDIVYDPYIQWRSWGQLTQLDTIHLPSDIDPLVQETYQTTAMPVLEPFAAEVNSALSDWQAATQLQYHLSAHNGIVNPDAEASEAWQVFGVDEEDNHTRFVTIKTRLGQDSVQAVPLVVSGQNWRIFGTEYVTPATRVASREWIVAAAQAQVRFNRARDIERLVSQRRPKWWERSALLRHLFILELSEDGAALHLPKVALNAELGLVYTNA